MFSHDMFLSTDEVERLTGTNRKKSQIEYFKDRGIPVQFDKLGRPIPLRSFIVDLYHKRKAVSHEPNFDAI